MAQQDSTRSAEADSRPGDFAFCDVPASGAGDRVRVCYSLPLFHEIDFGVNEGFRKVPHGGVETAGLLFGSVESNEIRIEAMRAIECEHAAGPSLTFSQRDLAALEKQIRASASDVDLKQLQLLGWFLGHTRRSMEMSEEEVEHFQRLFPGANRLTVIVKPERFQPTRFGFLVRQQNGEMPRDSAAAAVILPLPGRAGKLSGSAVPSIPAPNAPAKARKQTKPAPEAAPVMELHLNGAAEINQEELNPNPDPAVDNVEADKTALPVEQTAGQRDDRRKLARERARLIEEAFPTPPAEHAVSADGKFRPYPPALSSSLALTPPRFVPSAYDRFPQPETIRVETPSRSKSSVNARAATALALASLLGCVVGYVAYLQLPAPVISMDVRPIDQTIIVSWPPNETERASYAAIRLNDGTPVPLSDQEKRTGHIALSAAKDFKLEIVARNWIRDSRGIVRYLRNTNSFAVTEGPPAN